MTNRIAFNRCRYVVAPAFCLEAFCRARTIPVAWIREKRGKHYLRLWGRWKARGVNENTD